MFCNLDSKVPASYFFGRPAKFWGRFEPFWALRGHFRGQDEAQNYFGVYPYRLITFCFVSLAQKYQLHTFLEDRPNFGVVLSLFGPYEAIFGVRIRLKTILGSTHED